MKSSNLFFLILAFFSLISCEKEIDVDVVATEPKLVIEAKMSDKMGDAVVLLSMSRNLNDTIPPTMVSNAEVRITEMESQQMYYLTETEQGIYTNEVLEGEVGKTYQLEIILVNGQSFSSIQTMPVQVEMTDIMYQELENPFADDGDEPFIELKPIFMDPAGVENFYQYIIKRNGIKETGIFVNKDLGFDGLENSQKLFIEAFYGDQISIELHNITSSAYVFLLGVQQNLSQSMGTPTNPTSNISGGALGYFKVFSSGQAITFILEE